MVSVKEATEKAIEFAKTVLHPAQATALRLEEIDTSKRDAESIWLITLSMPELSHMTSLMLQTPSITELLGPSRREYKTFAVSRETGEVLSMKIRELANSE